MDEWMYCDISDVSESEFPIHCAACRYLLTGLGEEGCCPECGQPFERRLRLWELWGDEAFRGAEEEQTRDSLFSLFLHSAIVTASMIGAFVGYAVLFGRIDCTTFAVWLALVTVLEAILLRSGSKARRESRAGKAR